MVEEQLLTTAALSFSTLLLVFLLSLGLTAGQLVQLLLPARSWAPRLDRLGAVVGLLLAYLVSMEVVRQSAIWLDPLWQVPLAALVFSLAAVVPYVQWRLSAGSWRSRSLGKYLLRSTLALFCAAAAGWSGDRYYALDFALDNVGLLFQTPGQMAEVRRFVAVTDAGQRLPLYRWKVTDDEFLEYCERSATRLSGMTDATIQRGAADRRANCHGWVFTGGRFLMYGPEVEKILQDNAYSLTDQPQAEDLVIYRNDAGQIVHTGLVRGVLSDGTVMVESKFGIDGRFLHQPQDQPFSQYFVYYRSARSGHVVVIEPQRGTHASHRKSHGESPSQRGVNVPQA